MWNGLFFQRSTLHELGLRVQLGHAPGRFCSSREACHKDFRVIHTNGIHRVNVDFCRCQAIPHHVQLLRIAWWPGTPIDPKTCTTMEALQQFDLLNVQGKVTGFSYYRTLEHITDNPGLNEQSVGWITLNSVHVQSLIFSQTGPFKFLYDYGSRIPSYEDAQTCVVGVLIPAEFVRLLQDRLQFLVERVQCQISIFQGVGRMYRQRKRKY
jgi:hypothetical protein